MKFEEMVIEKIELYNSYEAQVRTNRIPKPIVFKLNRLNVIDVCRI